MSGVEDCFYHEAIATGNPGSKEKQAAPAISQIPGWGSDINATAPPLVGGRRMGLFEHDSDYVRLAKMGGRANLLSHPESANRAKKERVTYSKPDWMVYEQFTPSSQKVKVDVIPDYMIHDRCVPSHLPGGGKPPWAEDGQSCFRREGEESVRSYKTAKIENLTKPGQKRLEVAFNTNNNNSAADMFQYDNNNSDDRNGKQGSWTNRRYQAGVRLGELEADFREARRGREQAVANATASLDTSAPAAGNGALGGYLPSSPTAPRRHSPQATTPLPPEG